MGAIVGIFLVISAAGVILPTLPRSRRARIILAVLAIPIIVFAYQRIEVYASYIGATQMDLFVERSERLIKEGKTNILLAAYQEYREQHGGRIPKSSAVAYRAWLLEALIKEKEIEVGLRP